ncbi:MAG: hypothetical protein Q9201_002118 [Fulgogasparrea decipioides]
MDPLSIAAGVVTFMGACNALASTIQKLHRLRNTPKELKELENEINDLKTCMGDINRLVQMHSGNGVELVCQTSLGVYVENARKKIQEIQKYLEHTLLDTPSSRKIRASAWLKWQPEFHRLRQELRDLRSEIGTCISLFNAGAYGPEKSLRISRVRPGLDEVFIQVQSGNVRRLQQLFIQGDASPLDASDTGWTLLHYALTAGQLPTVKFLKDAGADVRAESVSRQTPIEVAWNRILSGSLDGTSEVLLRAVFDDDAQLDERQFTTLHKIVLGMTGKLLAEELDLTTAYINALDSSGNTPLAWASARGDHESVVLLLEYGASLSIANDVDAKPIHLAAQTGNINTIQALVKGGADINSVVRKTNMTPIHYAAEYQNSYEQIKGLASLGAHVDGRDYLEWTPLHWASWRGHLASLNALIDHGADVNAKTIDGNASIMLAVANNSHECVQKLIELGADCSVVRASQWNVLHYAAIGGSLATIRSLKGADISGCNLETLKTKDTGQSVTDMLSTRLDALVEDPTKREAWKFAWDRLMVDSESDLARPLTRSDTDNTFVDADDTLFANREKG